MIEEDWKIVSLDGPNVDSPIDANIKASTESYYYNLGLSYLILGNTEKALEQQEKLRTIDVRVADQLASVIIKPRMA